MKSRFGSLFVCGSRRFRSRNGLTWHLPRTTVAQLVVIGAGPGGYAAAFAAADLGMNVVLVNAEQRPGGVCLHRGCIPSKALLHVAKLIQETRAAKNWGLAYSEPSIDLDALRAWKRQCRSQIDRRDRRLVQKPQGPLPQRPSRVRRFANPQAESRRGSADARANRRCDSSMRSWRPDRRRSSLLSSGSTIGG